VYSPDEMIDDPHFVERGFPEEIFYDTRNASHTHPGAPYRFSKTPWTVTRAPQLGEHQALLEDLA